MAYENYEALRIEREARVLRITIDRPEARNAINARLHWEFSQVWGDVAADEESDVVILTGSGDAFCAGGDLSWLLAMHGNPAEQSESIHNDRRIQNGMLDLEKPVIARVKGPAVGLGCSLALFCDFVYATPDARFADPHVSVGLVAGDGGALIWPQHIGYARARRYLLTGDPITGADAAAMGLITEAVPAEELDATVDAMATRLCEGARHAIRWTKASINAGLKQVANAVLDRAAGFEAMSQTLEDHRIALEAFQKREKPRFVGR